MKIYNPYKGNDSLNELARQIVKESKHIPNFAYHGDADLGNTWAFTFSVHRDSDCLERSNWEVISEDMIKKHPKSVIIDHCNHWAVGWIDHLSVKMLDKRGRITRAGRTVLDWLEKLSEYPVANEDHYSELECEENYDNALESIKYDSPDLKDDLPENWRGLVYEWVSENDPDAIQLAEDAYEGWLRAEVIKTACDALGYTDEESE